MGAPAFCPACDMPLALFTPRDALAHVNQCLDAQQGLVSTNADANVGDIPSCAVCSRDLSNLTEAARNDHVNRCVDSNLPLPPRTTRRTARRARQRPTASGASNGLQTTRRQTGNVNDCPPQTETGDSRVNHLLEMLGLSRFSARFAREEVDLVALRLLSESDLAAMSIPESGRRRIADAMHSVEILAELQRKYRNEPHKRSDVPNTVNEDSSRGAEIDAEQNVKANEEDEIFDAAPVPTQQFARSRLQQRVEHRHSKAPLGDASDDEDYIPSMRVQGVLMPPICRGATEHSKVPLPNSGPVKPDRVENKENKEEQVGNEAKNKDKYITNHAPAQPLTVRPNVARNASSSRGRTDSTEAFDNDAFETWDSVKPSGRDGEKYGNGRQIDERTKTDMRELVSNDNCNEMINTCSGTRPKSSQDSSGSMISSLASDLRDMSQAIRHTSQISMDVKLKKWREREIDREKCRHKRMLDRIEQKYAKALKQSFGDSMELNGNVDSEENSNSGGGGGDDDDDDNDDDSGFKHDVIDLTQDFCEAGRGDLEDKYEGTGGEVETNSIANENEHQWNIFTQSVSCSSVPRTDDVEATNECKVVPRKSDEEYNNEGCEDGTVQTQRCLSDAVDDDSSGDILDLLGLEHRKKRTIHGSGDIEADANASNDRGFGEIENDSDENILDLVDMDGNENEFGSGMMEDDENEECEETESRLKKRCRRPKASRSDIMRAIEGDAELHDDVLLMHSVGFSRIWNCVKKQNLNVSKKAVHEFVLKEGIMFKWDSTKPASSQNYLRMLNADPREV